MIVGAMRPVESGKEDRPADKQQEQQRSCSSDQSLVHLIQPQLLGSFNGQLLNDVYLKPVQPASKKIFCFIS